jgi:hypothetical protein
MQKNKPVDEPVWVALTDSQRCRLLRVQRARQGTPHVDPCDALDNERMNHEHGRPAESVSRPPTGGVRYSTSVTAW